MRAASESRNEHISFSQTPVKTAGKNASTTVLPRRLSRETFSRLWLGRVKSGAWSPVCSMEHGYRRPAEAARPAARDAAHIGEGFGSMAKVVGRANAAAAGVVKSATSGDAGSVPRA